jgi:hypothetical protein
LYDALQSAEPISLELDRNLQVLLPSQAAKRVDLPPAFFSITADELKREQQLRFVERFVEPLNKVHITRVHRMSIVCVILLSAVSYQLVLDAPDVYATRMNFTWYEINQF